MARCPNCGRETLRTSDWCCQWCGYPLLMGGYKKIDKTYQELKEERLPKTVEAEEEPEEATVAEAEPEPEPAPKPEPAKAVRPKPEPVKEPEPEFEPESEKEPEFEEEPEMEAEEEVAMEPEHEEAPEPEPAPVSVPPSAPAPATGPTGPDIETTVAGIVADYAADAQAAEQKYTNKILKLTGVVERIESRRNLGIAYISLTTSERNIMQGVRCNFGIRNADEINQLSIGQEIALQGRYDGSVINMSLRDCFLV